MTPYPYMYVVVFHQKNSDYGSPIIRVDKGTNPYNSDTYLLFDKDMVELLPIIEYVLQLPRGDIDLIDLDEEALDYYVEFPHYILMLPDSIKKSDSQQWDYLLESAVSVFLCDSVDPLISIVRPILGLHHSKDINNELLKKQWEIANDNIDNRFVKLKYEPILIRDNYIKCLPMMFLARQFQESNHIFSDLYQTNEIDIDHICNMYLHYLIVKQKALLSLSKETPPHQTEEYLKNYIETNLDSRMKDIAQTTRIDVVIIFPGISKRQRKLLNIPSIIPNNERRAVELMGLHRAIAQNAAMINVTSSSDKLYQLLDELEQQLKSPYGTNNPHIWKVLRCIGQEFCNLITEEQRNLLIHAKHICVFSEYPIGLAIFPDQELPLIISHSLYYEPLIPLSRQFTIELSEINHIELFKRCNILFVECIQNNKNNQLVYEYSELLASNIRSYSLDNSISSFVYKEAHNIIELKQILNQYSTETDILILSAHGFYDNNSNTSGLCIGENDLWMAEDNDIIVPPIVLLSACHISPRGRNAVNACDLLMRSGAVVVLSTLIPINVYRNTLLFSRLFAYLFEAIKGNNSYKTLADLWTGIVATNAINEIIDVSDKLKQWYVSENPQGTKRLEDFMLRRSSGRLYSSRIYSETICIIKEMLAEEGLSGKYNSLLKVENCFPESFFYQMIGYPENVHLINPATNNNQAY